MSGAEGKIIEITEKIDALDKRKAELREELEKICKAYVKRKERERQKKTQSECDKRNKQGKC